MGRPFGSAHHAHALTGLGRARTDADAGLHSSRWATNHPAIRARPTGRAVDLLRKVNGRRFHFSTFSFLDVYGRRSGSSRALKRARG